MVPLRFISETMGMDVVFDGNHGTIFVNSPNAYESMNTPATMEPVSYTHLDVYKRPGVNSKVQYTKA